MFVLTRNLSSGSNVPEPIRLTPAPDMTYKYGSALVARDGVVFNASAEESPMFIAGETFSDTSKKLITCYPITPGMVFRTTLKGDPSILSIGDKVKLKVESGYATAVSDSTDGGVATIFDMNGAQKSGDKIYVRFN